MFQKMKLKKKIKECMNKITDLEQRRSRSQAALVTAILTNTTPDDKDVDYFNDYTMRINEVRDNMHQLQNELEQLQNSKK